MHHWLPVSERLTIQFPGMSVNQNITVQSSLLCFFMCFFALGLVLASSKFKTLLLFIFISLHLKQPSPIGDQTVKKELKILNVKIKIKILGD